MGEGLHKILNSFMWSKKFQEILKKNNQITHKKAQLKNAKVARKWHLFQRTVALPPAKPARRCSTGKMLLLLRLLSLFRHHIGSISAQLFAGFRLPITACLATPHPEPRSSEELRREVHHISEAFFLLLYDGHAAAC